MKRINIKKLTTIFLLSFFCLAVLTAPVFGHCLLIEEIEEGKVKVYFDDGTTSENIEVTVFDEKGTELTIGNPDENGYFRYSTDLDAYAIVANDGVGHLATLTLGEGKSVSHSHGNRTVQIISIVLIFSAVAFYFYRRKSK
ncbi:hypothetical protein SYNTR_1673 [Candidatus Syntrophocurvum alkaliphilum]|uniref:Uncharacterized protein n=1 Tax=Candidatus Syntrophocurvum alkaliphilum TaxID=2293317 RepID=A0A6I6DLJ2_9FIRM|nr:hypothetical protein [Candidatus Syntrophocurvum alkaliphilum]QGU00267.1 hypothetical protein SYNTR_1673 [Candidatus Syntrophocurvum alkaliphilum]